jgi:tRNA U34 2-thiouridine synthase MnmA/TrmU
MRIKKKKNKNKINTQINTAGNIIWIQTNSQIKVIHYLVNQHHILKIKNHHPWFMTHLKISKRFHNIIIRMNLLLKRWIHLKNLKMAIHNYLK